eukprot:scaffold41657_cov69-Phaeocystis_antarctica.AAC.3
MAMRRQARGSNEGGKWRKPQFWSAIRVIGQNAHSTRVSRTRRTSWLLRGGCAVAAPLAAPQQRCSSRGALARSRAFPRRWLLRGGSAAAAPRCFPAAVLEPRRAGTKPCAPAAITAARRQCRRRASLLFGSGARAAALVRSRARLRRWLLRCGSASIAMASMWGTSPLPSAVGAQRAAPGPSRCGREPSHCCHSVGLAAAPGCKTGPAPARA